MPGIEELHSRKRKCGLDCILPMPYDSRKRIRSIILGALPEHSMLFAMQRVGPQQQLVSVLVWQCCLVPLIITVLNKSLQDGIKDLASGSSAASTRISCNCLSLVFVLPASTLQYLYATVMPGVVGFAPTRKILGKYSIRPPPRWIVSGVSFRASLEGFTSWLHDRPGK